MCVVCCRFWLGLWCTFCSHCLYIKGRCFSFAGLWKLYRDMWHLFCCVTSDQINDICWDTTVLLADVTLAVTHLTSGDKCDICRHIHAVCWITWRVDQHIRGCSRRYMRHLLGCLSYFSPLSIHLVTASHTWQWRDVLEPELTKPGGKSLGMWR